MKTIFTLAIFFSIITHGYSEANNPKKPKGCTTSYCNDWDWKNKKGLFDPHSIQWPLHYNGKTYLDHVDGGDVHIDVVFSHYGHKTRVPLKDYRNSTYHPDPWFLDKGIKMHDPFTCEAWAENKPHWKENNCAMIDDTFEDQIIPFDGLSCSKIIRHWTIVDWCKWEPNGVANTKQEKYSLVKDLTTHSAYWSYGSGHYDIEHDGWYTFDQVIKVLDKDPPEFYHCEDVEYDLEGSCETKVKLTNKVVDSGPCPGKNMEVEVKVYDEYDNIVLTNWVNAKHAESFYVNLGYMKAGNYYVHWFVKDGCGNKGDCIQKLKVIDKNPPHLICIQDLSTSINDDSGATIWAKDFVHKVQGACYDEHLTYSFYPDSIVTSLSFHCPDGVGLNELEVYVTGSNGVASSCNTSIYVADHSTCDPEAFSIAGKVTDKFSNPINKAEVMVVAEERFITSGMTNENGNYDVRGISFDLGRPALKAKVYEDDSKKAIDAVDLLYMLRHIQGIEKLANSDQRAAADVNSDGNIDMEDYWDLIDIIYDIPGRDADIETWKFYDEKTGLFAGFSHTKLVEPVKLARYRHVYSLIGLKTGDIDFSWRPGDIASGRSSKKTSSYAVSKSSGHQIFKVNVPKGALIHSLSLDGIELEDRNILSVKANGIHIPHVLTQIEGNSNIMVLSTSNLSGQTLSIETMEHVQLNGFGQLYLTKDGVTEAIDWQIENQVDPTRLMVHPNPFDQLLSITLTQEEVSNGSIELYSIQGQLVQTKTVRLDKGLNRLNIDAAPLQSGMYLLVVKTENSIRTKRIVKN